MVMSTQEETETCTAETKTDGLSTMTGTGIRSIPTRLTPGAARWKKRVRSEAIRRLDRQLLQSEEAAMRPLARRLWQSAVVALQQLGRRLSEPEDKATRLVAGTPCGPRKGTPWVRTGEQLVRRAISRAASKGIAAPA